MTALKASLYNGSAADVFTGTIASNGSHFALVIHNGKTWMGREAFDRPGKALKAAQEILATLRAAKAAAAKAEIDTMAAAARTTDEDAGSARHCAALDMFFAAVEDILPTREFQGLEDFCLKATNDEMIDEALRLVGEAK